MGTHTRTDAREESDTDASATAAGLTKTHTATREEPDQDGPGVTYCAIPRAEVLPGGIAASNDVAAPTFLLSFEERFCPNDNPDLLTRTLTEAREEPDQELSVCAAGTETFTKASREEADQDLHLGGGTTIPRHTTCC